ncbi:MAG: bifunctional phosphoglucose/phosphomannose isomerase [Thermoplasmataceae archaeon]
MKFLSELKTLSQQIKFPQRIDITAGFKNIVIAGMGGSGIVGKIFAEIYNKVPVTVVSGYEIPSFVDSQTLFIAISYSGNTEETLSAFEKAEKNKAQMVAITSGGSLADKDCYVVRVPPGLQPRSAIGYMFMPLYNAFFQPSKEDIDKTESILKELDDNHQVERSIANEIYNGNRFPVIMSSNPFSAVGYRWRTQFNENSKIMAMNSDFPELNHNETMPLKLSYSLDKLYFIAIRPDDKRIERRMQATQRITGQNFRIIDLIGDTTLQRIFYAIHVGDYISYELALLRGVDPTDVSLIEELKRLLRQ